MRCVGGERSSAAVRGAEPDDGRLAGAGGAGRAAGVPVAPAGRAADERCWQARPQRRTGGWADQPFWIVLYGDVGGLHLFF